MKKLSTALGFLMLAALSIVAPVAPAKAAMISNADIATHAQMTQKRAAVAAFVARDDVQKEMTSLGVNPQEAKARVTAMSDAQVNAAYNHLQNLPAGGGAIGVVVGAAVFIFIVLLITDILGLTHVFNFTKPIR